MFGGDGYVYRRVVVMVSQGHAYFQSHQAVYIKYVLIFVCQLYFNK